LKSIFIGIIILAAAVFAILPPESFGFGLGWKTDVSAFLKGASPVIAILIALIAIFVGIADIKDRAEAKKEDAEIKKNEENV
jgi:F0F1-type ATP synthase assembly protein I